MRPTARALLDHLSAIAFGIAFLAIPNCSLDKSWHFSPCARFKADATVQLQDGTTQIVSTETAGFVPAGQELKGCGTDQPAQTTAATMAWKNFLATRLAAICAPGSTDPLRPQLCPNRGCHPAGAPPRVMFVQAIPSPAPAGEPDGLPSGTADFPECGAAPGNATAEIMPRDAGSDVAYTFPDTPVRDPATPAVNGPVSFVVNNSGSGILRVVGVSLSSTADFKVATDDCMPLASFGETDAVLLGSATGSTRTSCTVSVVFAPANPGARSADLSVRTMAGGGTGTMLTLQGTALPGSLTITPDPLSLGSPTFCRADGTHVGTVRLTNADAAADVNVTCAEPVPSAVTRSGMPWFHVEGLTCPGDFWIPRGMVRTITVVEEVNGTSLEGAARADLQVSANIGGVGSLTSLVIPADVHCTGF
jgi:hypothetical protein